MQWKNRDCYQKCSFGLSQRRNEPTRAFRHTIMASINRERSSGGLFPTHQYLLEDKSGFIGVR